MAKKRKSGRKTKAIPVGIAIPAAYVAYARVYEPVKAKNWTALKQMWTGIGEDGKLVTQSLVSTYGPLLVGVVAHKAAARLGLNKHISRATMGWVVI